CAKGATSRAGKRFSASAATKFAQMAREDDASSAWARWSSVFLIFGVITQDGGPRGARVQQKSLQACNDFCWAGAGRGDWHRACKEAGKHAARRFRSVAARSNHHST